MVGESKVNAVDGSNASGSDMSCAEASGDGRDGRSVGSDGWTVANRGNSVRVYIEYQ